MATTVTTAASSTATSELLSTTSNLTTKNDAGSADRFLKLLVAQMKNQDPLKPMDNAEVTSQMAQIQTVSGVEKLNTNITNMVSQMSMLQGMQGAALVGRNVMLEGSEVLMEPIEGADGKVTGYKGYGGFDLDSQADLVRVEILDRAGKVLDRMELGPQARGRHTFGWDVPKTVDPTKVDSFRVVPTANGAAVGSTRLMHDRVASVITGGPTLMIELQGKGAVPYSDIKSFN